MDSRRLLQSFDHMRQQLNFNLVRVRQPVAVGDEKIADHSLAAFVNEKAVTEDAAALDGCISWKDLRVDIAQDHLRRSVVIPGKQAGPGPRLIVKQGTQINGGKMSEVENLHGTPANAAAKTAQPHLLRQNSEFSAFPDARQTAGTWDGNIEAQRVEAAPAA